MEAAPSSVKGAPSYDALVEKPGSGTNRGLNGENTGLPSIQTAAGVALEPTPTPLSSDS